MALREDQEDLSAFDERAKEPALTYEELLKYLKAHGRIKSDHVRLKNPHA